MSGKRLMAGLAGFAVLAGGCEDRPFGSVPSVEYKEYTLGVDCTADPEAQQRRDILVQGVQILRLSVVGPGYDQRSRVQIFPGDSDVHISGPAGEAPQYIAEATNLREGRPVVTDLAHGSLTILSYTAPTEPDYASAAPSSEPSAEPELPWLAFALSCEPGGVEGLQKPEQ